MVESENDVSAIVFNRIEFYFNEPLTEDEQEAIGIEFYRQCIECFINHNGRVVVINADELEDGTKVLAQYSLIENIAKIKHIIEYDIVYNEEPEIVVSLH